MFAGAHVRPASGRGEAMILPLPIAEERSCGSCTVCCTVLGVRELAKPMRTPCAHDSGKDCRIYAERPQSCRDFSCLWLLDEESRMIPATWRPDRKRVMWTYIHEPQLDRMVVQVWEVAPHALNQVDVVTKLGWFARSRLVFVFRYGVEGFRIVGPPVEVKRTELILERNRRADALAKRTGNGEAAARTGTPVGGGGAGLAGDGYAVAEAGGQIR